MDRGRLVLGMQHEPELEDGLETATLIPLCLASSKASSPGHIRSLFELRRVQHGDAPVASLKVAPRDSFIALRLELCHRVERCLSVRVLLGEPDLISTEGMLEAVSKNRGIVSVEDELGSPGVGPPALEELDEPLHKVGVQTAVEFVHQEHGSPAYRIEHGSEHAHPPERALHPLGDFPIDWESLDSRDAQIGSLKQSDDRGLRPWEPPGVWPCT